MSKRKSTQAGGLELTPNRAASPEAPLKSSSGEWPELSSPSSQSSSSSSKSYSSKMTIEGSSTAGKENNNNNVRHDEEATVTKDMVLVGCTRCYMYVMSSEVDPKCPMCKSTVFLDVLKEDNFKTDDN